MMVAPAVRRASDQKDVNLEADGQKRRSASISWDISSGDDFDARYAGEPGP
jgi:hypothetical protein